MFNKKKPNPEIIRNLKKIFSKKNQIPDKKIILVPLSFRLKYHQNNPDQLILNKIYSHFKNAETINTSFPNFFTIMNSIGANFKKQRV